jgi:hypothetical protein
MRVVLTLCCVCFLVVGCGKDTKVEIPTAPKTIDTSSIVISGIGGGGDAAKNKPGK